MILRILLLVFFLLGGPVNSAHYQTLPDKKVDVFIRVYVADIFQIDDSQKSANVKFFVNITWKDKRLKGKFKKLTTIPLDDIWHPRIEIMTRKNLVPDSNKVVNVDRDGTVSRLIRYTGTISFKADYKNFPFDHQILDINFITNRKEVHLKVKDFDALRTKKFSIEGWVFDDGTFVEEKIDLGRSVPVLYDGVSLKLNGKRKPEFYLWKVFYPLTIILLIAGAIFGINPGQVPARISVTTVATLTLVAYDFIIANMVPTLSYLTLIDVFYFSSLGLVFYAFSGAVVTTYMGSKNIDLAVKISHILGVIYLLLIVVLYIIVIP